MPNAEGRAPALVLSSGTPFWIAETGAGDACRLVDRRGEGTEAGRAVQVARGRYGQALNARQVMAARKEPYPRMEIPHG